jgi:hypothetical protein
MTDLVQNHGLTGFSEATFNHLGVPVFSATTVRTVMGIWDSEVLDGTENLLNWTSIEYEATKNDPSDRIYVYWRKGATADLSDVDWSEPSLNDTTTITGGERYIQIRLVVAAHVLAPAPYQPTYNDGIGPSIQSLLIKGVTNATSSLFFTKTYDLGFYPKSVVTTTEADIPAGAVLRIGVTSLDSTDLADYQFVEADSLAELDQLSVTGTKFKLVLEMSGDSGDTIVVHEIAAMFSGEGQVKVNE